MMETKILNAAMIPEMQDKEFVKPGIDKELLRKRLATVEAKIAEMEEPYKKQLGEFIKYIIPGESEAITRLYNSKLWLEDAFEKEEDMRDQLGPKSDDEDLNLWIDLSTAGGAFEQDLDAAINARGDEDELKIMHNKWKILQGYKEAAALLLADDTEREHN